MKKILKELKEILLELIDKLLLISLILILVSCEEERVTIYSNTGMVSEIRKNNNNGLPYIVTITYKINKRTYGGEEVELEKYFIFYTNKNYKIGEKVEIK